MRSNVSTRFCQTQARLESLASKKTTAKTATWDIVSLIKLTAPTPSSCLPTNKILMSGRFVDNRPFYLIRAGHDARRPASGQRLPSTRTQAKNATTTPQALAVLVDFPEEKRASGIDGKHMDTKIEVFYNGQFVGADLSPVRGPNQQFISSGTRLHHSLERPWVFQPPDSSEADIANNTRSKRPVGDSNQSFTSRWRLINQSLAQEATLRGCDATGRPLPMAAYLASLANTTVPQALSQDANPVSPNLGIIDIVISNGNGGKGGNGPVYAYGPERLKDPQKHTPTASPSPSTPASSQSDTPSKPKITLRLRFSKGNSPSTSPATTPKEDARKDSLRTTPSPSVGMPPPPVPPPTKKGVELSVGSVLTYAEEGVCRHVRKERIGDFREEDVLFGVRYVVG